MKMHTVIGDALSDDDGLRRSCRALVQSMCIGHVVGFFEKNVFHIERGYMSEFRPPADL